MLRTVARTTLLTSLTAVALGGCQTQSPSPLDHAGPSTAAEPGALPGTAVPGVGPMTRPDQQIGGGIVPRSHAFPPGRSAEIRKLFSAGAISYPISVVSAQGTQTQFVQPKPVFIGSDRFVVGAPPEFHAEIDRLIEGIAKAPPAPSSTYDLTLWVIEADAAAESSVPPDLAELAPTLDAISGLGKRRFKSIDRVAGRELDGERAELKGRVIALYETLSVDPDGLRLQIELQLKGAWPEVPGGGPSLMTSLQLKPDTAVVLGDSTLSSASDGAANLLLYVVRARRVD